MADSIFQEVLDFWFDKKNTHMWFSATLEDDKLIKEKFERYLNLELSQEPSLSDKIGIIILWDQMVRHFYRGDESKISHYHTKALELASSMLEKSEDLLLPPGQRCFLLLPLRHTFDEQYLEIVINRIKVYKSEHKDSVEPSIYNRFFRATLQAYSKIVTHKLELEPINERIINEEIFKILDDSAIPNLAEISDLKRQSHFSSEFRRVLEMLDDYGGITISISGGVDSMVCSFVLHHLLKKTGKKLIAVMVNYNNRDTCHLEIELVKRWCQLLDIPLYIRHIKHLRRDRSNDRQLYEEITRTFRFDLYKRFGYPVVLGHNRDDCLENIITNIRKSRSYKNLYGMSYIGTENSVTIVRPMCDIPKSEIYKFAKEYKIPHLYDSTPSWSDRGRIRDSLIPFLNQFDPAFIPGLFNLADSMSEIYSIYDTTLINAFRDTKMEFGETDVIIKILEESPERNHGFQFWKDIIYSITKHYKIKAPSNKSIRSFCKRIENTQYGKIRLHERFIFKYKPSGLFAKF